MVSLPPPVPLPLARHPRIHVTDFDEAALIYSRLVTPVRLTHTVARAPFSWRSHHMLVGPIAVSANEFSGGASAESDGPVEDYHLTIPMGAAVGHTEAGQTMVAGRAALLMSPGEQAKVTLLPGFRNLGLGWSRSALEAAVRTLTGSAPRTLRFSRLFALDSADVGPFLRLVKELITAADSGSAALTKPEVAAQLAETLLFRLLLSQPSLRDVLLSAPAQPAEPRYVRRAADYLDAHLTRSLTMAELTRVTGVSARALQLGFRRYRGCSPLDFLQSRRLERARVLLLTSDGEAGIGKVAQLVGFQHMGRFSLRYRARFGETPTRTLQRRFRP